MQWFKERANTSSQSRCFSVTWIAKHSLEIENDINLRTLSWNLEWSC